jgi:hypothetical protein
MGNALVVDYERLQGLERTMHEVANILSGLKHFERLNSADTGSVRIAQALIRVDDAWNTNRGRLAERVDELAGDCMHVVEEFRATDRKLYFQEGVDCR